MTGEGNSGRHSQPEPCFGMKTLKRHKMKRNLNDVVFIDVDGDNFHNVIIIDGPKSVQQNVQDSGVMRRDKRVPLESIISIDDDESTDIHPENGAESRGDLDSDASSSKRSCPASNHSQNSVGLEAEECQFIRERKSPVKLSKCKRTYSGKAPSRNRYGLDPMPESTSPESTSSESGLSDCELMEGSRGKLHEQWEQAYLKRKDVPQTAKSDLGDQPSASGSNTDTPPNIEVENMTEQHQETPVCSSSSNENFEKENLPSFFAPDGSNLGATSPNPEVENPFAEFEFKFDEESSRCKIESMEKTQFSDVNNDVQDEEASFCKSHSSVETQVNLVASSEKDEGLHEVPNGSHFPNESKYGGTIFKGKKKSVSREQSFWKPQPSDETWINCGVAPFKDKVQVVPEKAFFCTSLLAEKLDVSNEKGSCLERKKPVSGEPSSCHAPPNETQIKKSKSCLMRKELIAESMPVSEQDNKIDDITHAQNGQRDIINEREKLKETEEYKRAIEEEWTSRQRQLQLQAEEVQRLKKRRKAENTRLLDMERRQKQRVQEMRETQKKDEENMNMKEKIRLEVRKELDKLEMTCSDMASLLRGLEIHVGGGFCPSSNEVHAAYKRALLKFHPDRASRTDIYHQVEAEEKFKLISRMKEKFLLPS
ncbi:hypothetical protein VitviT2T_000003 [Vitis vinifera]|uniref:J domain-containing protein n=2 Tax=Vitis vinifera TaxID=29760 RepID=A0ABY9BCM6_VITVI|nr:uncharacterized protein LOC100257674 isoform X1 [Vitis vinifera]XP_010650058.1 uncharacterized protein LOC100257674 isoform X1 [Vitis vinifera]WJZ80060.1 hypothetical protein VitviT2T_000003 [Vitis vinifera]|eukprot:XP_010650054.1 PREDICTED: uncharacterized protein LOC100257674 isoform X1 [Vitis vinifera]